MNATVYREIAYLAKRYPIAVTPLATLRKQSADHAAPVQ